MQDQAFVARNAPQAQYAFIQWIRNVHPNLYRRAMAQSGLTMGDFASTIKNVFGTIKDTVAELAPAYIQTRAELELLKINIARARQGLDPVYSLGGAETGGEVARTGGVIGGVIQPWMLLAGVGLLAFLFLRR